MKTFRDVSGSGGEPGKKSGQFLSQLKSSRNQTSSASKAGSKTVTREIPVQNISDSKKSERNGVKATSGLSGKQRGDNLRSPVEKKTDLLGKPANQEVADPRMLSVRKMSSERFERLKFDFERGVPTESQDRRASETTDHIELQLKARDLHKGKPEPEPDEAKTPKEESIFAKGMKVSDFVKHINTVHPPSDQAESGAKTFKVGGPRARRKSESDLGGENEYIEMPEEGAGDGIYEFVGEGKGNYGCVVGNWHVECCVV